jgi:hypothetical protein
VQRGWFKDRRIGPCRTCGQHYECGCPQRYRSYEEKETDVALGAIIAPAVRSIKRLAPGRPVLLGMPPGNLGPHKRFNDVGYFSINETALRNSQEGAAQRPRYLAR